MSWFFGKLGKNTAEFEKEFQATNHLNCGRYMDDNLCIFYDDKINSCHNFSSDTTSKEKFLAVGIGINSDEEKRILTQDDWSKVLSSESGYLQLDGHFAVLRFNEKEFALFTDPLGLRDIYLAKGKRREIFFSTRTDLLLQFVQTEIDFSVFGSRWLLYNQISHRSIFKGIERILCGTSVLINRFSLKVETKTYNWQPVNDPHGFSINDFVNKIDKILNIADKQRKTALLLSGGLDSRTLLSILLNSGSKELSLFTFGKNSEPDVKISKQITQDLNLFHTVINAEEMFHPDIIQDFRNYSTQSLINNSFSSFLKLKAYEKLNSSETIFVDGGFGEIWRREFLYKLAVNGSDKIGKRDFAALLSNLRLQKPLFFSGDVITEMENGLRSQVEEIYEYLPAPENIGNDNWLDLFAIKTRLVNYYSHEQTILDQSIISVMPFIQQSLVSNILMLQPRIRKNGSLFREIICTLNSRLTKYPLAKGDLRLPFRISTFNSRVLLKLNKVIKSRNRNHDERALLLRQYFLQIKDLFSNNDMVGSGLYDRSKINSISNYIHSGNVDHNTLNEIDWLIAFECFRQSVN